MLCQPIAEARTTLPLWQGAAYNTHEGQYPALIGVMAPLDFIRLTVPRPEHVQPLVARDRFAQKHLSRGDVSDFPLPHLVIEATTGRVLEHDGRHRCALVIKNGGTKVPVAFRFRHPSQWQLHWMHAAPTGMQSMSQPFANPEDLAAHQAELERQSAQDPAAGEHFMFDTSHTPGGFTKRRDLPPHLLNQYTPTIRIATQSIRFGIAKPPPVGT